MSIRAINTGCQLAENYSTISLLSCSPLLDTGKSNLVFFPESLVVSITDLTMLISLSVTDLLQLVHGLFILLKGVRLICQLCCLKCVNGSFLTIIFVIHLSFSQ